MGLHKTFPRLENHRLVLRRIEEKDFNNIYKGLSDPRVIRYYGVSFGSFEDTREQMEWFKGLEKSNTGIWWAVCSKDNRNFYGAGGLNDIDQQHRKAEIGLWLLPDFWGQGIMQEAIMLILDYGFNNLELHRIEGFVESKNENCKKALSKIDFMHEGTMKDCEIRNGEFISLEIYAKLNPNELN